MTKTERAQEQLDFILNYNLGSIEPDEREVIKFHGVCAGELEVPEVFKSRFYLQNSWGGCLLIQNITGVAI